MKWLKKTAWTVGIAALALTATALITHKNLPGTHDYELSTHLPPDPASPLAQAIFPQNEAHPGLSGVYLLQDGVDAFVARLSLAEAAQKTLDVQYYIWHNDISGHLLFQSMLKAAERGVRVRLLLDDNNTQGLDPLLLALTQHPNIEVRLFNPFMQRNFRPVAYLSDFSRLNRRMHNKSFTADGVVSIVGGRNIGDEYFGAGDGVMFADLDVAATGPVVAAIQTDFDRYWRSESTYAAERILAPNNTAAAALNTDASPDAATQGYLKRLRESDFAAQLLQNTITLTWAPATLFSDDPAKGLGKALPDNTVIAHITPLMDSAQHELMIVSPYFVPTRKGTDMLSAIAQRGVNVAVLTNSLAATDVGVVHAGYAKYRRDLLANGVRLFELKPEATITDAEKGAIGGSSGASLHAKTFTVDGRYVFVGSFNMEPRSATLNTEMGLVFDHPQLAQHISQNLHQHVAEHTYAVMLDKHDKLQWRTQENGRQLTLDTEPQSGPIQRIGLWMMSKLPIEHLL